MREDRLEFRAGTGCGLSEGESGQTDRIAKQHTASLFHRRQPTPLDHRMNAFGRSGSRRLHDVKKHDLVRSSTGERLQRLDSPSRVFRSIDRAKDPHIGSLPQIGWNRVVSSGIGTALDVPVAQEDRVGESALFQAVSRKAST